MKKKEKRRLEALARYRQALGMLERHHLKSDLELEADLLQMGRRAKAWRAPLVLAMAWAQLNLAHLGQPGSVLALACGWAAAASMVLALAWFGIDGGWWIRWWRAKEALGRRDYASPALSRVLATRNLSSLVPVAAGEEEWSQTEQWASRQPEILAVWEGWKAGRKPVRHGDLRVLEQAAAAWAGLHPQQEPGKTPPAAPATQSATSAESKGGEAPDGRP